MSSSMYGVTRMEEYDQIVFALLSTSHLDHLAGIFGPSVPCTRYGFMSPPLTVVAFQS